MRATRSERAPWLFFGVLLILHVFHVVLIALFANPERHTIPNDLAIGVLNVLFLGFGIWIFIELRRKRFRWPAIGVCALCLVGTLVSLPFFMTALDQPRWLFMMLYDVGYFGWAVATLYVLSWLPKGD